MSRVVHFEIHAKDMDKMQQFYGDVFGWTMNKMGPELGGYRVIMTGNEPIGINGGMTQRSGPLPAEGQGVNAFVCIIGVDNIDTYIEKVKKAGGTVAMEKMDVPTVGLLAYFKDPEGNLFGIIQPDPAMMPK